MILMHVVIALMSTVYTTYLLFFPAKSRFNLAYILVSLTLLSGTYLVISQQAQLLKTCTTGLVYLGAMSLAIFLAHRRLPVQQNHSEKID